MRRIVTLGLAGLAAVFLCTAALVPLGPVAGRHPAGRVVSPVDRPATLVDSVAAVPASTQLVSPKAAYGLVYWFDPNQPITSQLSATTWGGPTVLPVVLTRGDWLAVRLNSRPNGSIGWVRRADVNITTTGYRIVISVSQRSLTVYQNAQAVYSAPVGVGRPQWPTPLGPSFVDAIFNVSARQQRIYGPVALITASHSNVLTEFEGGDGVVAIHAYPSNPASTAGVASSHGCIRASPQTMAMITQVPPGTPIDFNP